MKYQWYIALFDTSMRYQVSIVFFFEPSSEADALVIVPLAHSGRSGPDELVNGFHGTSDDLRRCPLADNPSVVDPAIAGKRVLCPCGITGKGACGGHLV